MKDKKVDLGLWNGVNLLPLGDASFDFSPTGLGAAPLLKDLLLKDSGHLSEMYAEGAVKQEGDDEDEEVVSLNEKYQNIFIEKGGRLIYKFLGGGGDNCTYLWKDTVIQCQVTGNYVTLRGVSHNEKFLKEIQDFMDSQWAPAERTGHIYAIIRQGMHLGLSSIGNAGIPLVSGNYTQKVLEDYRYVIKDLKSESPSGRLAIMRGPAGTGKTHLIRAMLLEVPDAMFVLISPDVVTNLAGPELLPLLMNYRGGRSGPIVLVLEDADKCLVARESTDMNSIQALLNLGDGILGSLLDIRIVATTNADEFKMDAAILRPGRLSKMLDVNSLDLETSINIVKRLLPDLKRLPEQLKSGAKKMSLAEVYSLARQLGWQPNQREVDEESDDDTDDMVGSDE